MNAERRIPQLLTAILALLAVLALLAAYWTGRDHQPTPAAAASAANPAAVGIVTTGAGTVSAKPDQLQFSVTLTSTAADTGTALARTDAQVRAVTAAVKKTGVSGADIATTGLGLDPQYDYTGNTSRITGYTATQTLQVLVRTLADAGTAISAAVSAGGNNASLGEVTLQVGDQASFLAAARVKAIQDARKAATEYADAAGSGLGQVVSIEETTSTTPPPVLYDKSLAPLASNLAAIKINPGRQQLSVQVKVRWSLS